MISWVIVLSLVTYRLTRFFVEDSLIDGQRAWLLRKVSGNEAGLILRDGPNGPTAKWRAKILYFLECPYCMSVWLCAASTAAAAMASDVMNPFFVWLAASGGTMIVWQICED